jgi:hypothetical protein
MYLGHVGEGGHGIHICRALNFRDHDCVEMRRFELGVQKIIGQSPWFPPSPFSTTLF